MTLSIVFFPVICQSIYWVIYFCTIIDFISGFICTRSMLKQFQADTVREQRYKRLEMHRLCHIPAWSSISKLINQQTTNTSTKWRLSSPLLCAWWANQTKTNPKSKTKQQKCESRQLFLFLQAVVPAIASSANIMRDDDSDYPPTGNPLAVFSYCTNME